MGVPLPKAPEHSWRPTHCIEQIRGQLSCGPEEPPPHWHVMLFERTLLAIEAGMLRKKKFCERFVVKRDGEDGEAAPAAASRAVEDKALRGANGNAVVISILTLQEAYYQKAIQTVTAVASELDRWHTAQNRLLRSTTECQTWLVDQTCGADMRHIEAFCTMLTDRVSLEASGVQTGFLPKGTKLDKSAPNFDLEVLHEDEQAQLFGIVAIAFGAQRLVRGLWMLSWPTRMVACLRSEQDAGKVIADFKADEEVYEILAARAPHNRAETELMKRHLMSLRSCKQFRAAFAEHGFNLTRDLKKVISDRSCLNIQSQIIEDFNGDQKNNSQLKACRRYRKATTCMGVCLSKDIISSRHRFAGLPLTTLVPTFDAKLPNDAFKVDRSKESMDFGGIVGARSPTWWSPGASNVTVPCADLGLLRWAQDHNQMDCLGQAWLGEVASVSHRLLIGYPLAGKPNEYEYFLGVHYFPKSAVALWPMDLIKAVGSPYTCCIPRKDVDAPVLRPILSMDGFRVATLEFKSWLRQCSRVPNLAGTLGPGVRMFVDAGGFGTLAETGCKAAFWDMSRTSILSYAKELGVALESGGDLFDTFWCVVQSDLKLTDDQVLQYVAKRVARGNSQEPIADALLQVDEAVQVLDRHDQDKMEQRQKQCMSEVAARNSFTVAYAKKAVSLSAQRGKKARGSASGEQRTQVLPHHIDQKTARGLIPPKTCIWRDTSRGGWCGHCPPNVRAGESFAKHGGSEAALLAVLGRLWLQALEIQGKDVSHCPIQGLFMPEEDDTT